MGGMNVCLKRPRSSASMTLMMMLTWPALSAYGGACGMGVFVPGGSGGNGGASQGYGWVREVGR